MKIDEAIWTTIETPRPVSDTTYTTEWRGVAIKVTRYSFGSVSIIVRVLLGERRVSVLENLVQPPSDAEALARAILLADDLLAAGFAGVGS